MLGSECGSDGMRREIDPISILLVVASLYWNSFFSRLNPTFHCSGSAKKRKGTTAVVKKEGPQRAKRSKRACTVKVKVFIYKPKSFVRSIYMYIYVCTLD